MAKININLTPDQAFVEIKKNCSQAIELYKRHKVLMFRGRRAAVVVDAFKSESPTNRTPGDSAIGLHQLYNIALEKVGIQATRANSIFVTGKYDHAREYGDVYVIFPVDGFNYSWSGTVDDIVLDQEDTDIWNDAATSALENSIEKWIDHKGISGKPDFWFPYRGIKESLSLAPWSKVINDLYRVGFPGVADLHQEDFLDFGKFVDAYDPRASNIELALKAGHEVMINGSYYAVQSNLFINSYLPFI